MPLLRRDRAGCRLHQTISARTFAHGKDSRTLPPGFTVLELLAVLAIMSILCALILPAMQQSREAARRLQCKNNLHQIGVALHAYHATTNCFPSGWIIEVPTGHDSQNGWGWLAMLLPKMDQTAIFNSINFNHHLGNQSNETARLRTIEAFVCPSDNAPLRVPFYVAGQSEIGDPSLAARLDATPLDPATPHAVMFEVAPSSYVGVFGPEEPAHDPVDAIGSGIFSANSKARFADVLDGLSQTLIVGERRSNWIASTWTGMHQLEEENFERVVGFTNHPPNNASADEAEFSSRHLGGANFLFGDGSVRFLSDGIDRSTYQALGTRSGQETIDRTEF